MRNIKLEELKRWLKRSLKEKVSINDKTIITFLMAGFFGLGTLTYSDWYFFYIDKDTGAAAHYNDHGNSVIGRKSIIIAQTVGGGDISTYNRQVRGSVVIGSEGAYSSGENSVVVGNKARVKGSQGTALGNSTFANAQATAIGNDVYSVGNSSIAIGNDDIAGQGINGFNNDKTKGAITAGGNGFVDRLPEETIRRIYGDTYTPNRDPATALGVLSWATFKQKYIVDGNYDNRIYSPTFSKGFGAIAIGSRSVAYGNGATTMGTLSFALADRSTALGLRAFTDFNAIGATAIGEESRVFAENTLAIGNKSEATSKGSLAFGANSRAVGSGSIAIGENVMSNATLTDASNNFFKLRLEEYAKFVKLNDGKIVGQNPDVEDISLLKTGNNNEIVMSGFSSKQSSKGITDIVNKIITGDKTKNGNTVFGPTLKIEYQEEGDTVITTSKDIKKTKKSGDHAISVGYYLHNTGDNTVAIGTASRVYGDNSVAIGALNYIDTKAVNSMAIGVGTNVHKENSIAIGTGTTVIGAGTVALGAGVGTYKDDAVAIGYGARNLSAHTVSIGRSVSIGKDSNRSMAFGSDAKVLDNSVDSIAFGTKAEASSKDSNEGRTIAIGNSAKAYLPNSVALGYISETDYSKDDLAKPGWTAPGAVAIPTSAGVGIISVGRVGQERRIANVASGYLDTDAVNVAQLRTIVDRFFVDGSEDTVLHFLSVNNNITEGQQAIITQLKEYEDYTSYVRLLDFEGKIKIRQATGENIDERNDSIVLLKKRIAEFEAKYNGQNGMTNFKEKQEIKNIRSITNGLTQGSLNAPNKRDQVVAKYKDLETRISTEKKAAITKINEIKNTDDYKNSNYVSDKAEAVGSIALGYNTHSNSQSKYAVAIGSNAKVSNAERAVAIGGGETETEGANSTVADGIALGSYSRANTASGARGYDFSTKTSSTSNNKEWKSTLGALSIGNSTNTRQITGLAAGTNDTDAVNVAQLKNAIQNVSGVEYFSTNFTTQSTKDINKNNSEAKGEDSLAIGNAKVTNAGYRAIAIGTRGQGSNNTNKITTASAATSIAIGSGALGSGNDGIAIGRLADARLGAVSLGGASSATGNFSTAVGYDATVSGVGSIGLGRKATVTGDSAIALGEGATASGNRAIAIGGDNGRNGSNDNISNKLTKASGNRAISIGAEALSSGDYSIALGSESSASNANSLAFGKGASATQDNGVALGSSSVANTASGVNGYDFSTRANSTSNDKEWKSTLGAVSIGSSTHTRQITGLAAGTNDTDAVNVAQLKTVTLRIQGNTQTNAQNDKVKLNDQTLIIQGKANSKITTKSNNQTIEIDIEKGNVVQGDGITLTGTKENRLVGSGNLTISLDATLKQKIENSTDKNLNGVTDATVTDKVQKGTITAENGLVISTNNGANRLVGTGELKIGLSNGLKAKLDNLPTNVNEVFAKVDASNITDNANKTKWRAALDVYDKATVETKVKAVKETVVADNNNIVTVTPSNSTSGEGKTFTVGLTADKVKEAAGTKDLGTLAVETSRLKLSGSGANRLIGSGTLTIDLSDSVKNKLENVPDNVNEELGKKETAFAKGEFKTDDGIIIKSGSGASRLVGGAELKIGLSQDTLDKLAKIDKTKTYVDTTSGITFAGDSGSEKTLIDKTFTIKGENASGISTKVETDGANGNKKLTISLAKDTTVTNNSTNVITSGGVHTAISNARTTITKGTDTNSILTITGGTQADITAKEYTIGLNETNLTNFVKDKAVEAIEIVKDTNSSNALSITKDTNNTDHKDTYTYKLDEAALITSLSNNANISNPTTNSPKVITDKVLKDFLGTDSGKIGFIANGTTTKKALGDNIEFTASGGNLTVSTTQDGKINYALAQADTINKDAGTTNNPPQAGGTHPDRLTTEKAVVDYVAKEINAVNANAGTLGSNYIELSDGTNKIKRLNTESKTVVFESADITGGYKASNLKINVDSNNNKIQIGLLETPTFNTVTATTSLGVTNGPTITANGIDMGSSKNNKITNLADGTADNDAVNRSQLRTVENSITNLTNNLTNNYAGINKKIVFKDGTANNANTFERTNNEDKNVIFQGSGNITVGLSSAADTGTYTIGMIDTPTFKNVSLKNADNKTAGTLAVTDDGNITLAKGNGTASNILTTADEKTLTGDGGISVTANAKILGVDATISITDGGITTAKLADKAITEAKLADAVTSKLNREFKVKVATNTTDNLIGATNPLEFTAGDNISVALDKANNKVSYSLNSTLTGITSIGKSDSSKLTFEDDKVKSEKPIYVGGTQNENKVVTFADLSTSNAGLSGITFADEQATPVSKEVKLGKKLTYAKTTEITPKVEIDGDNAKVKFELNDASIAEAKLNQDLKNKLTKIAENTTNIATNTGKITALENNTITFKDSGTNTFVRANNSNKNVLFKGNGNLTVSLATATDTGTFTIKVNETNVINEQAGKDKDPQDANQGKHEDRLITEKAVVDYVKTKVDAITTSAGTLADSYITFTDGTKEFTRANKETDKKVSITSGNNITVSLDKDTDTKNGKFTVGLNSDLKGVSSITSGTDADTKSKITLGTDKITLSDADKKVKLEGLADGKLADDSTEAVSGKQLKDLGTALGLTPDTSDNTKFKAPTFDNYKLKAVDGTDGTAPTSILGALKQTVDKLNEGIKYGADKYGTDSGSDTAKKAQYLGSTVDIKAGATDNGFVGTNLRTKYTYTNGNGKFEIGLTETPEFKSVSIKNGIHEVAKLEGTDANGGKLTLKNANGVDDTIVLNAKDKTIKVGATTVNGADKSVSGVETIKAGNATTDNKIELAKVNGNNKDVVITSGGKSLTIAKDNNGLSITGLEDRDITTNGYGIAGRAATESAVKQLADTLGLGNTTAKASNTVPAKEDNQDTKSILDKVQALRDGIAGNTVYTNEAGERLVAGEDGKYYKPSDIAGKKYVSTQGKEGYYDTSAVGNDGALTDPNANKVDAVDNVVLSLVNTTTENGKTGTTKPITLSNLAEALSGTDSADKVKKLLAKKDNLNRAVTLADLKAIAEEGFTFGANSGTATKKSLGSKVEIIGKSGVSAFTDYTTDNVATNITNDGKIEIGLLKTPTFNSIKLGETNKISITPDANGNKLTLAKDTNVAGADTKIELDGIKSGKIEANSSSVITGNQLHDLSTKLGVPVEGTNKLTFTQPQFKALKSKDGDADTKADKTFAKAIEDTIDKLNQGFKVRGNQFKDDTTDNKTQYLGSTVTIKAETLEKDDSKGFVGTNLRTEYSYDANGNGTIKIGLTENPEFKSVNIKDGNHNVATLSGKDAEGGKLELKGVNGANGITLNGKEKTVGTTTSSVKFDDTGLELSNAGAKLTVKKDDKAADGTTNADAAKPTISITGLTERNAETTTDYGTGNNAGRAATEGAVKNLKDTLDTLANASGDTSKDGKDGRNGAKGFDGADSAKGDVGPAGKDGLNGVNVNEKVNALRRGEAGPIVYTKADGTRIAKANDGKLYPKENVTAAGDLTDGTYVKIVEANGTENYYNKSDLDANGKPNKGASPLENAEKTKAMEAIEALKTPDKAIDPNTVVHTLANIDGTTNKPSVLSNVASGIDPTKIGVLKDANATDGLSKELTSEEIKNLVNTLNGLNKVAELNKAATVGDLQAVSLAGLNFTTNKKDSTDKFVNIHKKLSETISISGEGDYTKDTVFTSAKDNIYVDVKNGDSIEVKLAKAIKHIDSIESDDITADGVQPAVTNKFKLDKDGLKVTEKGADGTTETVVGKDGTTITKKDDNNTELGKATYGLEKAEIKDKDGNKASITPTEIKLAKDGANGAAGKDAVSIKAGDNTNGPSIDFAKDGTNGTGKITGLADVKDTDGRDVAANKGYVDDKLSSVTDKLDEVDKNRAFEYRSKDNPNEVIVRGLDGKLYKQDEIKDKVFVDGKGYVDKANKDDANAVAVTPIESDKVVIHAMPLDGNKPVSVSNVAAAKIGNDSKDVVNGSQLSNLGNILGLTPDDKSDNTKFKAPEFEKIPGEKDAPTNIVDAIKSTRDKLNSGIDMGADVVEGNDTKTYLGSKLNIKAGSFEKDNVKYSDTNIKTKYSFNSKANEGTISIGITEKPVFEEVKIGDAISLTKGEGTEKPTIKFNNNDGRIHGLADVDDDTPGHAAVNKNYVDTNVADLRKENKLAYETATEALGGVANAVAMANLLQVTAFNEYRHQLSAAYGYYGRQHAFAIGFSGISKNEKVTYRLSGSLNNAGNLAFGAGLGLMLGEKKEREKLSTVEVRDKIKTLEEENKDIKEKFENLQKENEEIKQMLKQLLSK